MTPKQRAAELLKEELILNEPDKWFIILFCKDGEVAGSVILKAKGPTHAWITMHGLNLCLPGESTNTGEITEEDLKKAMLDPDDCYVRFDAKFTEKIWAKWKN